MKNETKQWQRPFTAKRYLHPPFAQNIITMWPDLRIMCSDVVYKTTQYNSSAFRLLLGDELCEPNFKDVEYKVREDGIPIHTIAHNYDNVSIHMESFCDTKRVTTAFTKITIANTSDNKISDTISIIARSGDERHLTGMEVDGYAHFNPNICNWGFLTSGWKYGCEILTDDEYYIRFQDINGFNPQWKGDTPGQPWHKRHLLRLEFELEESEEKTFYMAFKHGEIELYDYEEQKENVVLFWEKELSKIKVFPGKSDKGCKTMYCSLVVQCLQMFCHPVDEDIVLPRQGGLQRAIWPVEAMEFLIALDRIGDFNGYTDSAYDLFFNILQLKSGDDCGKIQNFEGFQQWTNNTAGAAFGLSRHLIYANDKNVFLEYRDAAYLAFTWMQTQRHKDTNAHFKGIFPPGQASDWGEDNFQDWCWTDGVGIIAYQWLTKAFELYNDKAAAEIHSAYDDYMESMRNVLRYEEKHNSNEDEILISPRAGIHMDDPPKGPYMSDGPATLLLAGVIEPNSKIAQLVENYWINHGMMKNGLHGLMNDGQLRQGHRSDPWAGHTWYTSYPDLCWFEHWLNKGDIVEAERTIEAQMKYAMTPEFYMNERYADNDPYFVPWLPNASANGRFIMMLCDFDEKINSMKVE